MSVRLKNKNFSWKKKNNLEYNRQSEAINEIKSWSKCYVENELVLKILYEKGL